MVSALQRQWKLPATPSTHATVSDDPSARSATTSKTGCSCWIRVGCLLQRDISSTTMGNPSVCNATTIWYASLHKQHRLALIGFFRHAVMLPAFLLKLETLVGTVTIRSADGELCLGFDANTSAYGGYGNSVVARPCKHITPTDWRWSGAIGGSLLQLAHPHEPCSGSPGIDQPCSCAHPVVCTACHGTEVYTPPTSVELIRCQNGSHMMWSVSHTSWISTLLLPGCDSDR